MMMGGLISALGAARLKAELRVFARYAGVQTALVLALACLLAVAAAFAVTALTIWLAGEIGPAAAFAVVAAVLVVLAVCLWGVAAVRRSRHLRRAAVHATEGAAMPNGEALGSIAALALIGYLLGRRVDHR